MILKAAAAVGGGIAAPAVATALYRLGLPTLGVVVVVVAVVAFGVLRGGLLRWAAIGFGIGFVGFEAFVIWVIGEYDSLTGL